MGMGFIGLMLLWAGAASANNYFKELQAEFGRNATLKIEDIFSHTGIWKGYPGKCFTPEGEIVDSLAVIGVQAGCVEPGEWFAGRPHCQGANAQKRKITVNGRPIRWYSSGMYCPDKNCANLYHRLRYKIVERDAKKYLFEVKYDLDGGPDIDEMCYYPIE